MSEREAWLNGWPRLGGDGFGVLIGTGVHCVGCGQFQGITCVAFPHGYQPPPQMPDWPFPEDACPVHTSPDTHTVDVGEPCRICHGTGLRPGRTKTAPTPKGEGGQ